MKIKLWGVRGSLPAPLTNSEYQARIHQLLKNAIARPLRSGDDLNAFLEQQPKALTNILGGDTTCLEIRTARNNIPIIIDAGTGIRKLGYKLIQEKDFGSGQGGINIFFTHTHWDHIQGLPFFVPAYMPNVSINFISCIENLEERLSKQQDRQFFPVKLADMACQKKFLKMDTDIFFEIDGVKISAIPLIHPGGSYAYKFEENDKTLIFATDVEFNMNDPEKLDKIKTFFHQADILIMDSQYTLEEAFFKFDWGHTSYNTAVNLGVGWQVRKLVLTHHDPSYLDDVLWQILEDAIFHKQQLTQTTQPEIILAQEEMEFDLA